MELTLTNIIFLVLIGIGAAFVQRVSGFGLGIFAMLFLPFLMGDPASAAAVACLWSCVTSVYNAVKYRKSIDLQLVKPLLLAAALTIPLAVRLSKFVPGQIMAVILGVVLVVLSLYFFLLSDQIRIRASFSSGFIAGSVGGMLNGLFSTGGPPVVLYLVASTTDKLVYFASIQLYFAATNIYATVMRAINGTLSSNIFICAAIGLVGCLLGDAIGRSVFKKLNTQLFKQVIYFGMIISGLIMVFKR